MKYEELVRVASDQATEKAGQPMIALPRVQLEWERRSVPLGEQITASYGGAKFRILKDDFSVVSVSIDDDCTTYSSGGVSLSSAYVIYSRGASVRVHDEAPRFSRPESRYMDEGEAVVLCEEEAQVMDLRLVLAAFFEEEHGLAHRSRRIERKKPFRRV